MKLILRTILILSLELIPFRPILAQPTHLKLDDLDQHLKQIKPTWNESGWSQVPWIMDLNAARKKAAAEGKPLYVWSMSAEPLGLC